MILNMIGGGGGDGCVLTVTAPAGVTVSVSKDGKVKTNTADANGVAVFKGLTTGTWTLTITDGVQTSTQPVVITADYNTVIAFFSATINITYPAGSTCTCSDGTTTLKAPNTSGTWECIVSSAGSWTVSCTNGTESASKSVQITADGQSKTISLSYWDGELYDSGNEYTDYTGGWQARGIKVPGNQFSAVAPTITKNADNVVIKQAEYAAGGVYEIVNDIDLTEYKTLTVNVKVEGTATDLVLGVAVYDRSISTIGSSYTAAFSNTLAHYQITSKNFDDDVTVTLSGVNRKACVGLVLYHYTSGSDRYIQMTMRKAILSRE